MMITCEVKMGKMYRGNMPDEAEGWRKTGSFVDKDALEWIVFVRAQAHSPDWVFHKIVANGRAENKANYWLAKNTETGQIGYARDFVHMRTNRPELHKAVESIIA